MKTYLITIIAFFSACHLYAQDRIITNQGDVFEGFRIDIGSSYIYYTLEDKDDAPLQKIVKSDVLMIKKKDGTKIDVTEYVPSSSSIQPKESSNNEQAGVIHLKPEDLSVEAKAANDALIAKYNTPVELLYEDNKTKEKASKKKVNSCIACFGVDTNSIISNEDIEINYIIGSLHRASAKKPAVWSDWQLYYHGATKDPAIQFSIKNKSSQTLYLDLGNTFYVTVGKSYCYYIPQSTTSTQSSSNGGCVNLGAITGALGVGGAVGTLANGINVGSGSSNSTTSTTYSQRIISIAPMSTIELQPQYLFYNDYIKIAEGIKYSYAWGVWEYCVYVNFSEKMMGGDHYTYSQQSSTVKFSFFVSYSKSESLTNTKVISSNYYLRDLLGSESADFLQPKDIPTIDIGIYDDKESPSFPKQ